MNIVIVILSSVMFALLWFLADWYKEETSRERTERKILQDRITIGSTIIATTIVDIVREDGLFVDKAPVLARLQDAMAGLGYASKRYTEAPADPPDTQEGG